MELAALKSEIKQMTDRKAARERVMEVALSQSHLWEFLKMHYDWQQSVCVKCGAMRVVEPNGHTRYKVRGRALWNPFVALSTTESSCVADARSDWHPSRIAALRLAD